MYKTTNGDLKKKTLNTKQLCMELLVIFLSQNCQLAKCGKKEEINRRNNKNYECNLKMKNKRRKHKIFKMMLKY